MNRFVHFLTGIFLLLAFSNTYAAVKTWAKAYGGNDGDGANSIIQTSDGGFAVAGYTYSFGAGKADFWVLKLDANG